MSFSFLGFYTVLSIRLFFFWVFLRCFVMQSAATGQNRPGINQNSQGIHERNLSGNNQKPPGTYQELTNCAILVVDFWWNPGGFQVNSWFDSYWPYSSRFINEKRPELTETHQEPIRTNQAYTRNQSESTSNP